MCDQKPIPSLVNSDTPFLRCEVRRHYRKVEPIGVSQVSKFLVVGVPVSRYGIYLLRPIILLH